jgi:trimeric autotransporter adhesin
MSVSRRVVSCVLALIAAGAAPVLAQTYHGGLRGLVREQGAVVPGAGVDLINEATNGTRHTQTNTVGEYAFINVDPGTYTVKVTMQGFKSVENKGVRIGTQQFVTLDFALEVGSLQEAVTVEGQASQLETSNASVGSTLDSTTLQLLPTAGRNPFFLAITTPGVVATGDPQFVRQQDQTNSSLLSLGGGPRRGNNYTLDGVSIVDLRNRATIIPSIEAVEEVKIQVSTYDAEMGRTGGGVFNMTGKSGANSWHGSALGQARPSKARALSFFAQKACDEDPSACAKPATYFYLYGGSLGGPIVKDKTFFWATAEGYKTRTIDDTVVRAPSQREISGDFSQSGVTIYDPLTTRPNPNGIGFIRDPFPGNVIPANRISPVARAFQPYWPNAGPASAALVDVSKTLTFKLDQQWNPNIRSSAMYGYYNSTEPRPRSYLKDGVTQPIGANPADPGDGALLRTVHVIAVNNTITPNPTTAAHVRFGYTTFSDDCVPTAFDPGTLGFASSFVGQVPHKKFPYIGIGGYGTDYNGVMFGDRDVINSDYYSWDANASVSKLLGRHTLKFGGSYRKIGLKEFAAGQTSGTFNFDSQFTGGPDPLNPTSTGDPNALAAFLLGFPSNGRIPVATANDFFIDYYAGYVQDDFRINPSLTVNVGVRYEFEQGLQEKNDAFTVGFDRDRTWPFQVPGVTLKGGLMYAGVDGYPTHQSDPSKNKFAPRAGFAWSIDPKTVLRGGYGLFWAPYQYAFPNENNLGARGFTQITDYVASRDGGLTPCATCSIANPFPNGIAQPSGSANGILTGAGGTVEFVDQFRKSPYVHQFSLDLQRELPGRLIAGIGYIGSRTERIGVGGNDSNTVNINQLDPRFQALGTALLDQVRNPFFGDPRFGDLSAEPTIARGQLLRPYPQFGDLLAHQVSAGHARYHSMILRLERRITNGWGGLVNYTLSSNKSNVFGERNQFSNDSNSLARVVNSYDIEAEYSNSVTEAPHRLNFALTGELPFGKGKSHLSEPGLARTLLGGWALTAVGSFQSGFPVVVIQDSNNSGVFGRVQRPNLTGTSPATDGSTYDHYDPACSCISNWFNTAAWTAAPAFTFGNAPRTDTRMRTPFKTQTDVALQKVEPLGGSKTVMLRAEIINLFNNAQFNGPNTRFGSSSFGRMSSTRGFPRLLQVMLRFAF